MRACPATSPGCAARVSTGHTQARHTVGPVDARHVGTTWTTSRQHPTAVHTALIAVHNTVQTRLAQGAGQRPWQTELRAAVIVHTTSSAKSTWATTRHLSAAVHTSLQTVAHLVTARGHSTHSTTTHATSTIPTRGTLRATSTLEGTGATPIHTRLVTIAYAVTAAGGSTQAVRATHATGTAGATHTHRPSATPCRQ